MLVGLLLTGGKDKMQDVIEAIDRQRAANCGPAAPMDDVPNELRAAAIRWSKSSLETFRGELLRKAMLLAAAMTEMANELQNPS